MYYSCISSQPVDMKNIPLDRSIRIKLAYFAVDWGVLDAKLEPYSIIVDPNGTTANTEHGDGSNNGSSHSKPTAIYDKLLVLDEEADEEEGMGNNGNNNNDMSKNPMLPVATNVDTTGTITPAATATPIQSAVVVSHNHNNSNSNNNNNHTQQEPVPVPVSRMNTVNNNAYSNNYGFDDDSNTTNNNTNNTNNNRNRTETEPDTLIAPDCGAYFLNMYVYFVLYMLCV